MKVVWSDSYDVLGLWGILLILSKEKEGKRFPSRQYKWDDSFLLFLGMFPALLTFPGTEWLTPHHFYLYEQHCPVVGYPQGLQCEDFAEKNKFANQGHNLDSYGTKFSPVCRHSWVQSFHQIGIHLGDACPVWSHNNWVPSQSYLKGRWSQGAQIFSFWANVGLSWPLIFILNLHINCRILSRT